MTIKPDSTSEKILDLETPVSLTPDQIAEVAGGTAAAATISPISPFPIIFGGIWGPVIQDLGSVKIA